MLGTWVVYFIVFVCYHRIFVVYSFYLHFLVTVAYRLGLPFHSYLSEVADDGDVLRGVELEVPVAQLPSTLQIIVQSRHYPT